MKKIEIEIPDGKKAEWVDGVLTLVDEKPKDVTERVKTFVDACKELGDNHPLREEYMNIRKEEHMNIRKLICYYHQLSPDIEAYLKLRIICAALNEGWEPKFTEDERRYYPWFILYTKTELENMSEDDKKDFVIIDTGGYDIEYPGLAYAHSVHIPSGSNAYLSSRLCLKSDTLADYCGKQFINIWADYMLGKK